MRQHPRRSGIGQFSAWIDRLLPSTVLLSATLLLVVLASLAQQTDLGSALSLLLARKEQQLQPTVTVHPEQRREVAPLPASKAPFAWGVASAAYQVEGGVDQGGRGKSIWDTFVHTPNKTDAGDTGDVAIDFYHLYADDIRLAKSLGTQFFRMSLSWPRIFPQGSGETNQAGVAYYSAVIDALLESGIEPFITLYHWDLPQALQDEYGGWTSPAIIPDFLHYAETCFALFGDRVKYWTTFNEPLVFCFTGYGSGVHAPGRCSGDSEHEPYWCSHHVLLAHAAAVSRFRRMVPHGRVSMNLNLHWAFPRQPIKPDVLSAQRWAESQVALYADPLYFGDYSMETKHTAPFLPPFTPAQRELLRGSTDFFALNHYTTKYISHVPPYEHYDDAEGKPIGPRGESDWLYVVPSGFRAALRWVHARYRPAELYVTENGCNIQGEIDVPLPGVLNDTFRVEYYAAYISEAVEAAQHDGVNVRGYIAWSFMDNFEWAEGFRKRFGIVYVDYATQGRHVKASARWLASFFGSLS